MLTVLDPIDYWRLRALSGDWLRTKLELHAQLQIAKAEHDAVVAQYAAYYGFNPCAVFTLHDETCAIEIREEIPCLSK